MAKLTLKAPATFAAKVSIPVAGAEPIPVEFVFKHRTKSALDAFINSRDGVADIDSVMDMVDGWDLDEKFNRANVETLLENYAGASLAIYLGYLDELFQAKRKN